MDSPLLPPPPCSNRGGGIISLSAADATVSALFNVIISGMKAQRWRLEDAAAAAAASAASAAAAAAARGKLRDNQKMLTRSERAAGRARTNTKECTLLSYKVRLDWNPFCLLQKLCTQHIRHLSLLISLPYGSQRGPLRLRRVSSATFHSYYVLCEGTLSRIKTK